MEMEQDIRNQKEAASEKKDMFSLFDPFLRIPDSASNTR